MALLSGHYVLLWLLVAQVGNPCIENWVLGRPNFNPPFYGILMVFLTYIFKAFFKHPLLTAFLQMFWSVVFGSRFAKTLSMTWVGMCWTLL